MPSPQEALAALLRGHATPIPDEGYPGDEYDCCAEEVLKAGWLPPARKITDHAELDTLPLGSIVIEEVPLEPEGWRTDPCPNVLVRIAIDGTPVWLYRGETEPYRTKELVVPVMVVWQPEVSSNG